MKRLPGLCVATLALAAGCVAEDGDAPDVGQEPAAEVVFESVRTLDASGEVLAQDARGALSPEVAVRAGRPWAFRDEPITYDDEAWAVSDASGVTSSGYRVMRAKNGGPALRARAEAPAHRDAALLAQAKAAPAQVFSVHLRARGVPEWTIPLRPDFARSAIDLLQASEVREAALRERAALVRRATDGAAAQVVALGGKVTGRGRYGGWLTAEVPGAAVAALAARGDLDRVERLEGQAEPTGIYLGDVRAASRIDADRFHAAGYTGERPNSARHNHGDITVGVIEVGSLEDEACFLYDGAGCAGASRLLERFDCSDGDGDGNMCEPVANLADLDDGSATHGTIVTSIVAADYSQGQGDTQPLGDGAWTAGTGHSATWKQRASGLAPEASVVFFGNNGSTAAFADSFDDAIDRSLDITNSSWTWTSGGAAGCNPRAIGPHEQELENAYDDGVLNVVAAGNFNDPADVAATCNLGSPGDIPKALTINSVDGSAPACIANYNDCLLDTNYSATGGMNAKIDGVVYSGVMSGVDLVAPNWINNATSASGTYGSVGGVWVGTSMASPVVAGAAALVKDWHLAAGNTWINLPGRLQTVMLSMGDRHAAAWKGAATSQQSFGTDPLWGVGKLKLRLLENGQGMGPWGYHMRTTTLAPATPDVTYVPFATPIPAGAVMVKCVMMQSEDMSDKDDISKIDLVMRLRQPVNGTCTAGAGAVTGTRIDATRDLKKMGAIEDSQATVAGRCLEVTLENEHVTASGITTHAFCYYAGIDDDQ